MAGYRQFHTKFWKDGWVIDLDPLERYLFSYLFTNEQSSISGIYELPLKIIINETGLKEDFIKKSLSKFQRAEKIAYQDNIIWIVKMRQHHKNASPKTMIKVEGDVSWIHDCPVKRAYLYYQETGLYSMDTVSIPNCESVSESENASENMPEKSPGGRVPSKEEPKPPKNNELETRMINKFTEITGIKMMPTEYAKNQKLWYQAVRHMLFQVDGDIDEAESLLEFAIDKMKKVPLDYHTPNSVLSTYDAVIGKEKK